MNLKELDPTQKKFTANGVEYEIEESFSHERWMIYEKLQVELGYGISFQQIFSNLKELWEELQGTNFGKASVICYNMMAGIKTKLDDRIHPALRMCTLFINTADEDRRVYTEELAKKKIDDWTKEGIDVNSFFAIAIGFIPNFLHAYKEATQDTFLSSPRKEQSPGNANS